MSADQIRELGVGENRDHGGRYELVVFFNYLEPN
jgi:hypothetical protein